MANKSGTIKGTAASNGNYLYIEWEETSTSTANNTSTVKATAKLYNGYGSHSDGDPTWVTLYINGTKYEATLYNWSGSPVTLISKTQTVTHNSDGSKSISISATFDTNGTSTGVVSASGTATLTTIARTSVIGTVSNFNIESGLKVPVTKYSSSFTDTLTIKIGSTTIKTISGYTNNTAINFTDSELLAIYKAIATSKKSDTFTFTITTKSGSTTIGTSASKTATGTIIGLSKIKISGTHKNAVPWININGTWKRCLPWINPNGTWKRTNA